MRKFLPLVGLILICGCQRHVAVPTAQELVNNRPLLAEWQKKCNTGGYSHLAAAEKSNLCSTTQDATISVAEADAGKIAGDFYGTNTKRK